MTVSLKSTLKSCLYSAVDTLITLHVLTRFLSFTSWGILPSGQETHLPILTPEETKLAVEPYSSWTTYQQDGKIPRLIHRLQSRLGFGGATLGASDASRLASTTKDIYDMKTRLFLGMAPMSGETWSRKQLDDPENCFQACQYLESVVRVFQYLNSPDIQTSFRDTFNLISNDFQDFDFAINMKRQEQKLTPVSAAALWAEFMHDLFTLTTTRAHAWILERTEGLFDMYTAHFLSVTPEEEGYMEHAIKFIQRTRSLTQVIATADCSILLPMDGYKGYHTRPPGPLPGYTERIKAYEVKLDVQPIVEKLLVYANNRTLEQWSDQQNLIDLLVEENEVRANLRKEIRGEEKPRLGHELWISDVDGAMSNGGATRWGFVAYRLSYKETDQEYATFSEKFEKDLNGWGEWINGAATIKPKSMLHWIDGKAVGIPEGDVKAAKAYVWFQSHFTGS
jgi:hypothetical protein